MLAKKISGFSLVEMAVVLMIVGLLLGGLLPTLSGQMEQQHRNETRKYLDEVRDALLGFALANGRLPCPASSTSNGQESFCTGDLSAACGAPIVPPAAIPAHGRCTNPYNGFLPAATLGLSPTDAQGYAVDAWGGMQNRIRYAVYENTITGGTANYNTFTASGEIKKATMANIANTTPLLSVCASAPSSTTICGTALTLTNQAPAVIYSVGKSGATGGTGLDESANPNPNSANNDQVFVSHGITSASSANGEFDDIVTWLSTGVLFNRMLTAGQLP